MGIMAFEIYILEQRDRDGNRERDRGQGQRTKDNGQRTENKTLSH